MAELPDEMAKKLQEIVDSFKNMGQYSKDLQQAIAAANRPMQQMSDYTKAIREHIGEVKEKIKSSQEMSGQMAQQIGELAKQIKQMGESTGDYGNELDEAKKKLVDQKQVTEEFHSKLMQARLAEREFWFQITKQTHEHQQALKDTSSIWDKLKKQAEDTQASMSKAGGTGLTTFSETMVGGKGLAGGASNIMQSLSTLLPMAGIGGLVGMMISGKIREEDFRAVGETAGQMFDQITGHSKKFSADLGHLARQLDTTGAGAKEDVIAVAQAFASTGVSAEMAGKKVEGFSSKFGNNLVTATLAADKALELPAGTFAKMSGTLARDFNVAADKAYLQLKAIGEAARESGMNAATFMQQIMNTSSALTLMGFKMESIGKIQLNIANVMGDRGFDPAYAQQYSATGAANVAGGIQNMEAGLSAIIGERLGYGSGLQALYTMKTGMTTGGKPVEQDMVNIMKKMNEILPGQTRDEKWFAAKSIFGLNDQGAVALLDAMQESTKANVDHKKVSELTKHAFETETAKTNQVLQQIKVMQDAVAQISVAILKSIVDILKGIYQAIMGMSASIQSTLTFGSKSDLLAKEADLYKKAAASSFYDIYAHQLPAIGKGGEQFGGAAGKELGMFGLGGFNPAGVEDIDKQLADLANNSEAAVNAVGGKQNWNKVMAGDMQKFRNMLITRAKEIEQSSGGKTGSGRALDIAGSEIEHRFGAEAAGIGKLVIQLKTEAKVVDVRPSDKASNYNAGG